MIKIRLSRGGTKNKPYYRIVVVDSRRKRDGAPLEVLGYWHPAKKTKRIDKNKLAHWQKNGAKATPAVKRIIG
jgi:small subunit ribosomal protein S16